MFNLNNDDDDEIDGNLIDDDSDSEENRSIWHDIFLHILWFQLSLRFHLACRQTKWHKLI